MGIEPYPFRVADREKAKKSQYKTPQKFSI
jgi:hypothetical protein